MFNFTPDQQMALDFPGNVIVSAGAGSGKTRVLVEKYFRLLVDEHPEWPVDAVVAITFTRKAAAELKSRIIKRVLDELDSEKEVGPRRQRLLHLRADVGAAPIGTIHNFCGRILKEFSFDAHLNPDFIIVEGAREGALRLKAAHKAVSVATADKGSDLYPDLLGLLNVISASKLNDILAQMLAGRTAYLKPASHYLQYSLDELFKELHQFHAEYVKDVRNSISKEWLTLLRQLDRLAQPGKVKDVVSAAIEGWPADPGSDWWACDEHLQQVYGLLTGTGTCRKVEFKKAGFEEHDPIRSEFEELAKRCKCARLGDLNELDRADLQLSRRLARLFLKAVEIYEDLRGGDEEAEASMVDYVDLELMAEKLVTENAQVRRLIRERYKFLIMDEFQDTSESQWNIVRPLVHDEKGKPRPNCLFVVGDRKQGVYGFRDANVSLFSQVQDLVISSNEEWMGCRGRVSMAANFRTLNTPLSFINKVFERLLTTDGNNFGVEFEPLQVQKPSPEGCVEFLLSGTAEPEIDEETGKPVTRNADEKREDEARLVASHVAQLIADGEATPGQIALLFRKRSLFSVYENALKDRGIAVVTQQGFSLFKQPELADTVAALKAVIYPHKDLVFVHYLRSPVIGFSDDLLLKIARTPGRSFWDKSCRVLKEKQYRLEDKWLPITGQEQERLEFALDTLQEAQALVGVVSPYQVVRGLFDRLGLRTIVHASFRGEQAVANLDKLLAVARSAEFLSFEEFLEYVESEGQSDNGMAEAADLTSSDAVKIMTIHAAKGLEFPVVYLPDLNSGVSAAARTINGDGERWMTMRLPKDQMSAPSFLMDYFKIRDEQQSAAEERRVFYVAMTRCEQRLILSANCDKSRVKNTFYSWIEDDFQRGKESGLLKTEEDFPEWKPEAQQPFAATVPQMRREARIEAALRAAKQLEKLWPQPVALITELDIDQISETIEDLLPVFLRQCVSTGFEQALEVAANYALLLDESLSVEQLEPQLRQVFEWITDSFSDADVGSFFSPLRLSVQDHVHVFRPHVVSGGRCGWIVLGGRAGQRTRREIEFYQSLTTAVTEAPKLLTLVLHQVAESPTGPI